MIIIIRHGETAWNVQKRKQGHKNSDLTQKGRRQGVEVANFLNKKKLNLDNFVFYSSPLKRVVDYSKIINQNLNYNFKLKKKNKIIEFIKGA